MSYNRPNYLSPPTPLLWGNLYIFFGRHKGIYKVYFLIRAKPSPPSFGQCPKENIFFPRGVPLFRLFRLFKLFRLFRLFNLLSTLYQSCWILESWVALRDDFHIRKIYGKTYGWSTLVQFFLPNYCVHFSGIQFTGVPKTYKYGAYGFELILDWNQTK